MRTSMDLPRTKPPPSEEIIRAIPAAITLTVAAARLGILRVLPSATAHLFTTTLGGLSHR